MAHKVSFGLPLALLLATSLGISAAQAQRAALPSALPLMHSADQGPASPNTRLDRMLLLLEPPFARQQALAKELDAQQNPASPEFHHWLTPSAFAAAYSNAPADVAAVAAWLGAQGFQVAPLPASLGWIEFSGTAAQVEQAFQTQVDTAATAHGPRPFLASGLSVPAELKPFIHGLVSLDGAISTAASAAPLPLASTAADLAAQTSLLHPEALSPSLAAQLLQLTPLHAAGQTGAGQTIAIPSRSNVRGEDIAAFRSAFGLPSGQFNVELNGADPGLASDEATAALSASWAGAAAPGAQILLVPAASTAATDGLDLALAAIVDQAAAQTVAVGYSACEASLSRTHQAFYAALYRQAAAEGIAVIAAAGDSGAAACHVAGTATPVSSGYAVNALASTPWNTVVGVAAFGAAGPSSPASSLTAWAQASPADPLYAGGGGTSSLYAGPAWQPSVTGNANRLLPDLSLPTAVDSVNPGLAFCLSGAAGGGGCTLVRSGGSAGSTAIFAGIAALVAQKYGPQGNLAPNLYALSRQNGIFSDVQHGAARMPCEAGTSGCAATGLLGYSAIAGYDMATGLGVVNAQALVAQWKAQPQVGTDNVNVSLLISPFATNSTYNPSAQVTLTATVLSLTGHGTPTGTVSFYDNSKGAVIGTPQTLDANGVGTLTIEGVFATGGNEMVAIYSGDATYASVTSQPPVNVNIQLSTTNLAVVPSNYSPASGDTITVVVTLTVGGPPAGTAPPSGLVTLNLDGLPTKAALLSTTNGITSATFSLVVPVGSTLHAHALQATYAGDTNYSASTAPPVTINVAKSATTSVVTPATLTPYAGGSLVLSATVSASAVGAISPSGTFTFTVDGVSQGSAILAPGTPSTATLAVTVPSTGTHTVGGSYSGDGNNSISTAPDVTITVSKSPTTLAVFPSTTTPAPGVPLLLTANLSAQFAGPTIPTGSVTFTLDGTTAGTAVLLSGTTATLTITSPSTGAHTLQAAYGGDANYSAATAPSVSITVAKVATSTTVIPATATPIAGTPLVVTAAVSSLGAGATQPSGNVTFTIDGTSVGIGTLVAGSPSTASVTIPSLTAGTHVLQGTYSGDAYYSTSIAPAVNLVVGKSPTTTVVTPATVTPTAGGSLLVTASIVPSGSGAASPSGTVNFSLDGVSQGVQAVVAGAPSTASLTIPIISAGTHLLVGAYSGDSYYAASTSLAVTLIVAKGGTITTLAATPAALTIGATESFSATVSPINPVTGAVYSITGIVTFYDGGSTLLGRAVITNNVATLSGIPLSGSLNHTITAVYSGDTNWLASSSAGLLMLAITQPDIVVLTANYATLLPGQSAILTATVTPAALPALTSEQNPSGSIIFYNGTTVLGSVALVPSLLNDSSSAVLTIALPGGQDVLTAYYAGDLYYNAATSNPITLDVQDFSITPAPTNPGTNLNIIQGSSGTAAFVVTGLGGFNNQVQIVCAVPSQDDMTCTASPQQVVPTATVTFVVQTFSTGNVPIAASKPPSTLWPRAAGGSALAVLGFFLLPFSRRARRLLDQAAGRGTRRFLTLLLLLAGLAGVGVGCSNVAGVSTPGTPLGVATLKITASSYVDNTVVSHSVYLTVNVLPRP